MKKSFADLNQAMPRRKGKREGFALIVTVSIMAFVVLILLVMASLVSVETKVADNNKSFLMARQNALVGLNKAIGQLQETAGKDQRVTAKADILATTHVDKKNLTGVWDSTDGSHLAWLVSGSAPDVTTVNGAVDVITVVGSGSSDTGVAGNEIVVETEAIDATYFPGLSGTQTIGHYGYWVGDEGVKAKASLGSSLDTYLPSSPVRRVLAQRVGVESIGLVSGNSEFLSYTSETDEKLKKLLTIDQMPLLSGGYLPNSKKYFHELTFHSMGVLANARDSGLKKNLTAEFESGSILSTPDWDVLRSYYQLQNQVNVGGFSISPQSHKPSDLITAQHGVHPIITQVVFGLAGSFEASPGVNELRQQYFMGVALWNPYNIELDEATYELDLGTLNGDTAIVTHNFKRTPPPGPAENTDYDFVIAKPEVNGFRTIFRANITSAFGPGEVKIFSIDPNFGDPDFGLIVNWEDGVDLVNAWDPTATAYEIVQSGSPLLPVNLTANQVDVNTDYSLLVSNPAPIGGPNWPNTTVRLKLPEGIEKTVIQEVQLLAGASGKSGGGSASIDIYPSASKMVEGRMFLKQAGDYAGALRWLVNSNPRSIVHRGSNAGGPGYFPWTSIFTNGGSGVFGIDVDPVSGTFGFAGDSRLATGSSQVILYNVPRKEVGVNSIGDLQHANLTPFDYKPSFAIGNSLEDATVGVDYSYDWNDELWDEYFFATFVSSDGVIDDDDFTNRRFVVLNRETVNDLDDLESYDRAAENLLIDGAFNINSVSVEAWTAFLASMRGDAGVDKVEYHKTPFQEGGTGDMWAGFRGLSDAQIDVLARNIVAEIEANGLFLSLSEFVNRIDPGGTKGLLQRAIDDSGPLGEPSVNDGLGYTRFGAPGFVTQADLLKPLGPFLQVRSDTFLIRAYGDVRNPVTDEIEGRAWCEAVVQRLPEEMDDYATYGRSFDVVMFHWLTQDEI
jgi:Tfp pilus assembly protein PilX